MRCYVSVACALSVLAAVSLAAPTTLDQQQIALNVQDTADGTPLADYRPRRNLETVANITANLVRNFDIATLRRLCPQLFQVIDNVIQNVTSTVFRVVGRAVLQSGGLGGGGDNSMRKVSVVLPTFGPIDDDLDDEDEDDEEVETNQNLDVRDDERASGFGTANLLSARFAEDITGSTPVDSDGPNPSTSNPSSGDPISNPGSSNPISNPDSSNPSASNPSASNPSTSNPSASNPSTDSPTSIPSSTTSEPITSKSQESNEILPTSVKTTLFTSPSVDNTEKLRRRRDAEDDQEVAASGGNVPLPVDDLSNIEDDADRDKRFLPFGGSVSGHAGGGSAGGSGNFLFDIIRRTADGAARAAGTVYRMVAGTENLGFGLTASATSSRTIGSSSAPKLVAGSGASEATDEKDNAPGIAVGAGGVAEIDVAGKGDGYTEGIPGPITRLFVLANRGLANLVQDLILRLAQTSERIVNFKARLVTSLI